MNHEQTEKRVVSRGEWLKAREALLAKEKAMSRERDALAAERRALPWEKVEKSYVFEGPAGKETLPELFAGRSQLVIYHFMFGPEWKEGCPSCSFVTDHIDGMLPHLANRDVTLTLVSRATSQQIEAFKKRMGWKVKWVSSNQNDFNWDYQVSFSRESMASGAVHYNYKDQKFPSEWPSEEAPGLSVFTKDSDDTVFHTYSSFGRGGELAIGTYQFLDIVPKGRDEEKLPYSMAWLRHHDRYEDARPEPQGMVARFAELQGAK
jgi:predicted dithiol-disulfide oxidoreductase (DUF899 family)